MNKPHEEWKRVRPLIEKALEYAHGTHMIEDVDIGIAVGKYALWVGPHSAAITEIHEYPRAKFMHLFLAGGDLDELREMIPIWRSYAAFQGCTRLTLAGRRGWERALRNDGFEADLVCLSTPVQPPETMQ